MPQVLLMHRKTSFVNPFVKQVSPISGVEASDTSSIGTSEFIVSPEEKKEEEEKRKNYQQRHCLWERFGKYLRF